MQKNEKQEVLFLLSVQLYCALKLQEEYLNENFLEFKIEQYNKNLNEELMPACNSMINFLKKSSNDFVRNDNILEEVVKGEMLDYADRIKFDDDWIKINQIDAENKKRNGGLGVENLLDRFVGLHPGLTHGCGVPNGGTYIMVYNQFNTVTSDFYLPYIISSNLRPIQFTLLENKTLTLSGKVTSKEKPVEASILVGDATVFSNKEGFYNCLVAANTKLHVICTASGFKTLEKDVEIIEIPVTLDFSLEENKVFNTTTIQFIDQKKQKITDNITLIDSKKKQVIAENGILKVSDENGTLQSFKVTDESFEEKEFTVEVTEADKGEKVELVRVKLLKIQISDKSTGKFDKGLLKSIGLKGLQEKLVLDDETKGIFVSENKFATDKTLTVQVLYNNVAKEQEVSSDKAVNVVVYEIITPTNKKEILSWFAVTYPTEIRTEVVTRKLKSLSLNGVSVQLDAATNIGSATVSYDGTLTLDSAFLNAPTIKINNFEKIGAVIVLASVELITSKTDIKATKSMSTFNKALSAAELQKLLRTGGNNSVFSTIQKKSDLRKENFYCLLFPAEQMKAIKTMLNV